MRREEIEAELLRWMSDPDWTRDEERFESLALALFRHQHATCEPYSRYCRSLLRGPENVTSVAEIPTVPTGAFKEFELRCFAADATLKIFRTSGTSTERRGQLLLDTLVLYEASLLSSLRRLLLVGIDPGREGPGHAVAASTAPTGKPIMRFFAPSALEAPDSSLSHMFDVLARKEGAAQSGFDLHDGRLDLVAFAEGIRLGQNLDRPMLIGGTSFAFVHWLDATANDTASEAAERWRLPAGSRVMETGGFKGRSREVPRERLRAELADRFGLLPEAIVNQYGMTELGSQFYDSTLLDPTGPRRKLAPPWTRVRFVDPDVGRDVGPGEVGMVVIHDLANTGSIAAIQTADLGRSVLDDAGRSIGFDIVGRASGAEARGCSIATDTMLEASGGTAS